MSMTLKPKRSRPSLQLPQTPVEHPISSPSPSTDASESSDSDYEHFGGSLKPSHSDLANTVSSMPETELRSIVRKLASTNPWFRNALVRELTHPTSAPSSPGQPNTSFNPVPRHFRRKHSHAFSLCANCNGLLHDESEAKTAVPGDFKRARHGTKPYHPGRLEDELFDFITQSPGGGEGLTSPQKVSMWSCCGQEPDSMGCVTASTQRDPVARDS